MPELPEVEVVRAGLEPALSGARILDVEVFDPRSLKRHLGPVDDFVERLRDRRMLGAVRRGKFLWLPLAERDAAPAGEAPGELPGEAPGEPAGDAAGEALLAHLGMSGQLLLRAPGAAGDRHERIRLRVEHPRHGALELRFIDQRLFGSLAVDETRRQEHPVGFAGDGEGERVTHVLPGQVRHIARDALDPFFDDAAFVAATRRRGSGIKRLLLRYAPVEKL